MKEIIKLRLRNSRYQALIFFPFRLSAGTQYLASKFIKFFAWLVKSGEHTNYTYRLTVRNTEHLIWFVSNLTGYSYAEIKSYFQELSNNSVFDEYLRMRQRDTKCRKYDSGIEKIGRRIAWYAIVRAVKPKVLVETGTDKGLGSLVLAEAVRKNGFGKVFTIDINPDSGQFLDDKYDDVLKRLIGDSLQRLLTIKDIDVFIHDSNHSEKHESNELNLILDRLAKSAIVLTDNAHASDALSEWCRENEFAFSYFHEMPLDHWYSGASLAATKIDR